MSGPSDRNLQARNTRVCALCNQRPSGSAGEHVLPKWLTKTMFGPPPFTRWFGTEQELDRDGERKLYNEYPVLKLDCCKECNDALSNAFEVDRETVKKFFSEATDLSESESSRISAWMLKTALLLAHPQTEWDIGASKATGERIRRIHSDRWVSTPSNFYQWLIDGTKPPQDLSLYIHKIDPDADGPDQRLFALPEVHVDDEILKCEVTTVGILRVGLTLIYHPGWNFVHPLVGSSYVIRAWPSPQTMQLDQLVGCKDWPVQFILATTVGFDSGMFGAESSLDLCEDTTFMDLPGFRFATN